MLFDRAKLLPRQRLRLSFCCITHIQDSLSAPSGGRSQTASERARNSLTSERRPICWLASPAIRSSSPLIGSQARDWNICCPPLATSSARITFQLRRGEALRSILRSLLGGAGFNFQTGSAYVRK